MSPRARGFTLIEVLIALAVMSVGMTAVIGVFVLALRTHKRAIDATSAALMADTAVAEVRGKLTFTFRAENLPSLGGKPDPQAAPVLVFQRDWKLDSFPNYVADILLTPIDKPDPALADLFHVEVRVRWRERAGEQADVYHTVVRRRIVTRDLAPPG